MRSSFTAEKVALQSAICAPAMDFHLTAPLVSSSISLKPAGRALAVR